jgi:DNA-binding winged helix-turn-helix (wHTH) protein
VASEAEQTTIGNHRTIGPDGDMSQVSTIRETLRLDTVNASVWRGDEPISLSPKAFAVLLCLAKHSRRLVTKQELLDTVWPRGFVTDGVLKVCIREIRSALGDSSKEPRFIETLHRRGYRLIADLDSGGMPGIAPTRLGPDIPSATPIGREKVIADLSGCLDKALRGQRQVVFVSGEAGIGKTAVVDAFVERAVAQATWLVGRGQCIEHYSTSEPYFPMLEALNQICHQPAGGEVVPLLNRYAPSWLTHLPWLSDTDSREVRQREGLTPTRERMLREMAELLEALTAKTPLVLVLEDLHWGDYSTLDMVSMLARRRGAARLLLLITYRPVEVILANHPLNVVKQDLQMRRYCVDLPLTYLSAVDVETYLEERFPGHLFPPGLAAFIHQRTEGNPLFMLNVVDYLVAQGSLVPNENGWTLHGALSDLDLGVPESLRQMIERQVDRCAPEEQHVLEAASIAGQDFTPAVVGAVLKMDAAEIEACLASLARRGQFVCEQGMKEWPDNTVSARYAFAHALYQNALYGRQPVARRVQSHRRVGAYMERAYASRTAEIASELALHCEQGRDFPKAVSYFRQAAASASARYAHREAVSYLTRALMMAQHLSPEERIAEQMILLEERGHARQAMADMQGAAQDFEALAACAQEQGQLDRQTMALVYAATTLLWVDRKRCLAAAAQLEEVATELDDDPLRTHVRGLSAYLRFMWRGWRNEDARACSMAVEAARRADDLTRLNLWLSRYSYFQTLNSQYEAGSQSAEAAVRLALRNGSTLEYLLASFNWAWALLYLGEFGKMHAVLRQGIETAEKNGHDLGLLLHRLALAALLTETFAFEKAQELAEQALSQARESHFTYSELLASLLLGRTHLGSGKYQLAGQLFHDVRQRLARQRVVMDWILRISLYHDLSEYWYRQGNYIRARREAKRLCALVARPGCCTYQALGHRALAQLAMAEGHWDEARKEISHALMLFRGTAAPLAQWRVYATAAEYYKHHGDTAEANRFWAESRTVLLRLLDSLGNADALRKSLRDAPPVQHVLRPAHTPDDRVGV